MTLTQTERHSQLWLNLMAHFKETRETLRCKNDGQFDAVVTATLRGQIAVYTALIALDNDPPRM